MRVIIIGGGSAGTTTAFELRKLDKNIEITIIEASSNLEYSPCALPYVIEGKIKSFKDVFLFNKKAYSDNNINILLNSIVTKINKKNKKVYFNNNKNNKINLIDYDKLIIATGNSSFIPPIEHIEKTKYYTFKNIDDAKKIMKIAKKGETSAIIGAGMIGVELAYALSKKGNKVKIIESKENILPNMLDNDMAEILKEYLALKKIEVFQDKKITKIANKKVYFENETIKYDKLFLCTGVKANIKLAKECGLKTNKGIQTDEFLRTSDKDIYACGDCSESKDLIANNAMLSQLGTTAVRQAKVIAKNILELDDSFLPVINNTISKIGDLYVASVGLTKKRAEQNRIKILSAKYSGDLRAHYYSDKEKITVKIISDLKGKIIGCQIMGHNEVVGRINLMALAIANNISLQKLSKLETCYNPASSPIFDPITIASDILLKKLSLKKAKR